MLKNMSKKLKGLTSPAFIVLLTCVALHAIAQQAYGQKLNENCIVSILNRTTPVREDGAWDLPNVPSGFGPIRARATCVNLGITTSGESELFTITAGRMNGVSPINLGSTTPIPNTLTLSASPTTLTQAGQPTQLSVIATYANGSTQNVTAASAGTQYIASNPAIATVSVNGLVTAVSSGTVVIQAINEGTQGITTIQVLISGASHGGIPDSWSLAYGLDLTDPAFPSEDPDHDGLTNLQEFQIGSDPTKQDTDGDGLTDGQEVLLYHTNPLLADTDGDGIPDGLEVQTNTDPVSASSFNLAAVISTLTVTPSSFVLNVNTIIALASKQLSVTAKLIDGKTTLDLTSTQKGTNYLSSNLNVCNFGAPDGNVFAGSSGTCTITITNSGFTTLATVVVNTFAPTPLSFVSVPGFANSVAVSGNYAFIAAGAAGLQVVNVLDRSHPVVAASLPLLGNANDIVLLSNRAYVAAGSAGLHMIDISNPLAPVLLATLSTYGNAMGVAVRGGTAYIANGTNLLVADVTTPGSLAVIGSRPLNGKIQAVDVDVQRRLAVVAAGTTGIHIVDVSDPTSPQRFATASTGNARDVVIRGNFAFVADYVNSTTSVDLTFADRPIVASHIQDSDLGGLLLDITSAGNFTLGADVKFVNGIPITDISIPSNLQARAILNFPQRDDNGMGIALDGPYVYLATEHNNVDKFGASGDSRLYIAQYLALDENHTPPTVTITSPLTGSTAIEGSVLPITVNATDDISVSAVNFLINGQIVFTTTSPPYQFNYSVPTGISNLSLGATAVDLASNLGTAQTVVVNVIPDSPTTVVGRVLGAGQNPILGAVATTFGKSAVTAADGSFSIAGVPTIRGSITATATATIDGIPVAGVSTSVPPVFGGITNVGNIGLGGLVVATNGDFNNTSIIKGSSESVVQSYGGRGLGSTFGVAVSHDGSTAVVANQGVVSFNPVTLASRLVFINTNSFPPAVVGFAPLSFVPSNVAITSDGRFAVAFGGSISSVDMTTQTVISQLNNVGFGAVAITPDNRTIIVTAVGPNNIEGFRVLTLSSAGVLSNTGVFLANPGRGALSVTIAPNGRFALVANTQSADVTILLINSGNVTVSSTRLTLSGLSCGPGAACPSEVAFTADGSKAYVLASGGIFAPSGIVAGLNIDAQDNVTDSGVRITIPQGTDGGGAQGLPAIAISSDGVAYIASPGTGTLTVLDTNTNTVLGTISIGGYPYAVAVPR
jgi:YVTN family beta-propeller protein